MKHIGRRRFLQGMAGGAAVFAGAHASRGAVPATLPWEKRGLVLASEGGGRIQNFTSCAEALGGGRWRLWYSVSGEAAQFNIGWAEGEPGGKMERHSAVLSEGEPADAPLAIGNLPAGWRPTQGVHVPLPGNRHRLYFWAHGPKIVRYLTAESDDGRRYRVRDPLRPCLYHPGDRAVDGATAAGAGLSRMAKKATVPRPADEPAAPVRLVSNDATNVYRLPDGTFEMYSVALVEVEKGDPRYIAHDNCAGWVRVIDRYTSADGLDWTDRRRILVPDAKDPPDQQFYFLSVTHTPRGRLGMLGHYRVGAQTMDIEACWSDDGIRWERPQRTPWIARGQPGEPDSYGIYAPHALAEDAGLWHLFYTGVNDAHNHKHSHGPPTRVVMHATCKTPWL